MRCDANAAGCLACQQKNLRCVTTDRITGRATERGQADRLENEIMTLRRQLAAYVNKYGHLDEAEYQDLPAGSGSGTQHSRAFDQANNCLPSTRGKDGPEQGPINGTMVDVLDGEVDVAAFECLVMAEFSYGSGPLFNHSTRSYIQTVTSTQKPEKPALPPKEDALRDINTFLRIVNTYVPILHGPSTMELVSQIFTFVFQNSNATRQGNCMTIRTSKHLLRKRRLSSFSYAT